MLFFLTFFAIIFQIHTVSAADLDCKYIYNIQEKFLNLHINFSNRDIKNHQWKRSHFKSSISSLEKRTRDQFIKSLDMEKIYFTKKDERNVHRWMNRIFSQLKKDNCSSLDRVYQLYLDRVMERVQFAKKYLKKPFSIETTMQLVLDARQRKRPNNKTALDNFQKKYIQYQMANAIVASDKESYTKQLEEAKDNILRYYDRLQKRVKSWDVHLTNKEKKQCYKRKKSSGKVTICKPDRWYSIYLSSFAQSLDPHSNYLSQEDQEDFEINMRLSLDGIGASLSTQYGHTIIERLIPGGAAARSSRLRTKDKILAVGQTKRKMVNIFDMSLRDVVGMIRGKKGTPVYLKILRMDRQNKKKKESTEKKIFIVRLIRDRVNLEDQAAALFYFDRTVKKKKYKVGVISVPSFYGEVGVRGRSVSKDVKKLLKQARKKVSALVLDLSNNGGGSLLEAIRVAGLFFAKGGVVRQLVKTTDGDRYLTLSDVDKNVEYRGPLVVLINRVSASASEIVSGTLQSYKRAVVVGGDHTFGKGSIQSVERLSSNLGSIRVTVGLFFIPNGFSTQLHGVSSDIHFPSVFSNDEIGEKNLDYVLPKKKIPSFLSQSAYVFEGKNAWTLVEDNLIRFLKQKSQDRIKQNKKFNEVIQDIKEIAAKKAQGYKITIAQVFSEAKKEEKEKEKEKEKTEKKEQKKSLAEKDEEALRKKKYIERPDVQEAVNIAVDAAHRRHQLQLARKNIH